MSSISLIEVNDDTPAVFVVHGIGKQNLAETSAKMYAEFDETIESILTNKIDSEDELKSKLKKWDDIPAPFVHDGFWGDYDDVESFFSDRWGHLSKWEKSFLPELWKARVISARSTYWWFIKQILGLLNLRRNIQRMKSHAFVSYPVYLLLAPAGFIILTLAYLRRNEILNDFLNDVRLYVDPRGKLERKIKEMIDLRVEESFMRLIGLDTKFRRLPVQDRIWVDGKPRQFKRVVWVAHSLGTVISYNVLGKLLKSAYDRKDDADDEIKEGVEVFRKAMSRFVTMGSPLDKVALLFGDKAISEKWGEDWRKGFLKHGEEYEPLIPDWESGPLTKEEQKEEKEKSREWWVNFYHYFDPVSGSLGSEYLFGDDPPANFHSRSGWIPGLSHNAYWRDARILRYVVSRAFGRHELHDESLKHMPRLARFGLWVLGYATWLGILAGVLYFAKEIVWPLFQIDMSFWDMLVTIYDCVVAAFAGE